MNVAFITGAARGIGEAIAEALALERAAVAVCDIDAAAATATADRIGAQFGVPTIAITADVVSTAQMRSAVEKVESTLGPISVLVNNAAIDVVKPFIESTEEEWDRIIAVNLRGTIGTCRAVLDGMIARGRGRIVNISSDAGRAGASGEAVYSGSKGGVIAFTKGLAREVARYGITVNCVCPGPTETAMMAQVAEFSQKMHDSIIRAVPMRRMAKPSDVAPAVAFLVGDGAAFITGQTLSVSGGLTMF